MGPRHTLLRYTTKYVLRITCPIVDLNNPIHPFFLSPICNKNCFVATLQITCNALELRLSNDQSKLGYSSGFNKLIFFPRWNLILEDKPKLQSCKSINILCILFIIFFFLQRHIQVHIIWPSVCQLTSILNRPLPGMQKKNHYLFLGWKNKNKSARNTMEIKSFALEIGFLFGSPFHLAAQLKCITVKFCHRFSIKLSDCFREKGETENV